MTYGVCTFIIGIVLADRWHGSFLLPLCLAVLACAFYGIFKNKAPRAAFVGLSPFHGLIRCSAVRVVRCFVSCIA